jgi:iron complex transport system permease protein
LKRTFICCALAAALLAVIALSLALGAMPIPLKDVLLIVAQKAGLYRHTPTDEQYEIVIQVIRLPRVLLGVLVGAALGISGAAIQGIFRNPLAEPALLGISAGASLVSAAIIALEAGALVAISQWMGQYLLIAGAFAGAGLAALLIYQLSKSNGQPHVTTMMLAGIAINALASAITGLITYLSNEQQLRSITFWLLGSLAGASWETVLCVSPFIVTSVVLLSLHGKSLNAFSLGEAQAGQLGIRANRVKRTIVILCTLAVGPAVAVSGVIGFVGLLVPHIIRLPGGVDNRYVLPASAILGALVLITADLVARLARPPQELPIGVVTALLGAPIFLYILLKDKKQAAY